MTIFNAHEIRLRSLATSIYLAHLGFPVPAKRMRTVSFKHLGHIMNDKGLSFAYKLEDGVSSEGIGMYFINRENIAGLLYEASGNIF